MNRNKIKLAFLIFSALLLIIFLLNIDKIFTGLLLLYYLLIGNITKPTVEEVDFIIASFLSAIMIIKSIFIFLHSIKAIKFLFIQKVIEKLENFSSDFIPAFMLVLFIFIISLTAPIIATDNPNFNKDVAITKLQPPLSKILYIEKKINLQNWSNIEFIRKKISQNIHEENRIYFSKIVVKDSTIFLFKGSNQEVLSIREVELLESKPHIKSKVFIAGSDEFGRDLFSRLIYGLRISVLIGILSVFLSFLIGSVVGYVAGLSGGFIDSLLMRVVDFFLSFPVLFLVIFLIAFIGNSLILLIVVFGLSGWMYIARLARNETLACLKREFIQSLILAGQTKFKIVLYHILPNTFSAILITLIFQMSNIIIAESALSFLGLGIQPPTPTIGGIIKSGYDYLAISWWISLESAAILIFIVLSFNLFAESLRKNLLR